MDKISQRVKVETAAKLIGRTPTQVRNLMRRDYLKGTHNLPIGYARPAMTGKSFRYDIYRGLLLKYIGLEEWPEEEE